MEIMGDVTYFVFILARISGSIMFNQIFARTNVPTMFQVGLSLMLSITVYGVLPPDNFMEINTLIEYVFLILKEIFIGFVIGHIIRMFMAVVIVGGEIMDYQLGLAMAKVFDPANNVSMGITAGIMNLFIMLIFFSVGGHLTLIQIIITSFKVLPLGEINFTQELFLNLTQLFSDILIFSVTLSLPIFAVEFITEMGVGIMMKAVPQIHLFVVNIPLKIIVGLTTIAVLVPSLATFLETLLTLMFEAIEKNLLLMV